MKSCKDNLKFFLAFKVYLLQSQGVRFKLTRSPCCVPLKLTIIRLQCFTPLRIINGIMSLNPFTPMSDKDIISYSISTILNNKQIRIAKTIT